MPTTHGAPDAYFGRRLQTMEQILAISAPDLPSAMQDAAQLIAEALGADKVDAMFLEHKSQTLVALGTSDTPMGHRQHALGLNRLPLANGGRAADVFQTGVPHRSGRLDEDPAEVPGLVHELGVRSEILAPVEVGGVRRGVLLASDADYDAFSDDDLRFLTMLGRWLGMVAQRSELIERLQEESVARGRRVAGEELVTVLAHDVRNLLTPVTARLSLLHRRAEREHREIDVRELDTVGRSASRLTRLVDNLLDVARLEGGAFAIKPRPVELVALLRETVSAFQASGRVVQVRSPDHLEVCLDPESIRQVIENLLSNALRHSPPESPIDVLLSSEPGPDGDRAMIAVSNEGEGVPPELVPRLFSRFIADSKSAGVGLGLYIASQIVGLHGGTIAVDSAPGRGARFQVVLPVDCSVPQI